MVHKGKVDREMIFRLETTDQNFEQRIDVLEEAVWKKDTESGETLFDHMEQKILEMQIELKTTLKGIGDHVALAQKEFQDENFQTNQRITRIENFHDLIEVNK